MERDFNKIVIVSLDYHFSCEIGKTLSQKLDMMFCDSKDLLEYDLIDKDSIKKFCTKEYLEDEEKKVFRQIASFENVVVAMEYDYLIHNHKILKQKSLIIFLKLSKTDVVDVANSINYQKRTSKLDKMAFLTIDLNKDEKDACEKIINKLGGML